MLRSLVGSEMCIKRQRRIRTFAPECGIFADWLRGIAANVLRNHLRRQVRRHVTSLNGQDHPAAADTVAEEREQAERIAQALAELPPHYEAVLRNKYLEQQSVAEIATRGGETPKAVESLLSRARQAFREVYQQLEDDRRG
jgi:RNA polymerase sigma-70 factor (ECF subfamily)